MAGACTPGLFPCISFILEVNCGPETMSFGIPKHLKKCWNRHSAVWNTVAKKKVKAKEGL